MNYLIVFLGAGIGGALRHGVNVAAMRYSMNFPLGTLLINVLGSFLMGVIIEYLALRGHASQPMRLLLTTGVLGGFTTFSAFSLEVAVLYERGQTIVAIAYAFGSVLLAVGALFAATFFMRSLLAP